MVHLLREQVGKDDQAFQVFLLEITGFAEAKDMDPRGLDRLLGLLIEYNYAVRFSGRRTFGERADMATERQVQLIQSLWCDWMGHETEAGLDAWLERTVQVSSLRFLTRQRVQRTIQALRSAILHREFERS